MNITLNDTITVNGADGKATEQSIASWSPEFIAYLLAYGHGVRMQRCTASVDKEKHLEARQTMFDSMAAGELPSGGGGGGPRTSVEDAGMIAYFNSKGSPVKFTKERCNGKNLDKYQLVFVRKAIWPSIAKVLAGLDKEAQIEFHKTRLPGILAENREKVLTLAMQDPNGMGSFIEAERMKREGKKPEAFAVEVDIQL